MNLLLVDIQSYSVSLFYIKAINLSSVITTEAKYLFVWCGGLNYGCYVLEFSVLVFKSIQKCMYMLEIMCLFKFVSDKIIIIIFYPYNRLEISQYEQFACVFLFQC